MDKHSNEYSTFNDAMDTILRADPKTVKAEMEREQSNRAAQRGAKGQRKRGRRKSPNSQFASEALKAMKRGFELCSEVHLSLSSSLQERLPEHLRSQPLPVHPEK